MRTKINADICRVRSFAQCVFLHCRESWSAQAWKLLGTVHVPKPVPKHVCSSSVQEVAKHAVALVYNECPSLYTCCAQIGHWLGHMHVYISKQLPSLGTPTSTAVKLHWSFSFAFHTKITSDSVLLLHCFVLNLSPCFELQLTKHSMLKLLL